jgi:dipeptidase E
VAYVPFAQRPERYAAAVEWFLQSYSDRLKGWKIQPVLQSLDEIEWADMAGIYIGGGNTQRLKDRLTEDGDNIGKLTEYINNDGSVYGGSAGAILLGKTILTAPEVSPGDDNGIDLLGGMSVACHFGTSSGLSEAAVASISRTSPVVALTEEAGMQYHLLGKITAFGADVPVWENGAVAYTVPCCDRS